MNCLNCKKEVIQTSGKRPKQYCDNRCKMQYSRKNRDNGNKPAVNAAPIHNVTPAHIVTDHIVTESYRNTDNVTSPAANVTPIIRVPATTQAAMDKADAAYIPSCPRGINPNIWAMQHIRKSGYAIHNLNQYCHLHSNSLWFYLA